MARTRKQNTGQNQGWQQLSKANPLLLPDMSYLLKAQSMTMDTQDPTLAADDMKNIYNK